MRSQITAGVERESLTYLCNFKAARGVERQVAAAASFKPGRDVRVKLGWGCNGPPWVSGI